ncbi:hypothetical protein [Brevundimonas sp.]|uniref:hypothetical protein n=1 Tax=Brevundimonas sp. TaxID=1871086 RepID=UPI00289D9C42|nr:hypothetical protein [Brevundimonas sp.]
MARFIGAILGAAHAANSGAAGSLTDPFFCNGRVARMLRDYFTGDVAQNDILSLGYVDWTTRFDPTLSVIEFTDFGTAITLDIGVAYIVNQNAAGAAACLLSGQDIATAAGSASPLKSVAIADRHKPLWQLAGYASAQAARAATVKDGGRAEVIATFKGGNPDAGTLSWSFYGSPQ